MNPSTFPTSHHSVIGLRGFPYSPGRGCGSAADRGSTPRNTSRRGTARTGRRARGSLLSARRGTHRTCGPHWESSYPRTLSELKWIMSQSWHTHSSKDSLETFMRKHSQLHVSGGVTVISEKNVPRTGGTKKTKRNSNFQQKKHQKITQKKQALLCSPPMPLKP